MQNITTYKLRILNTLEISFENLMREWRTLIAGLQLETIRFGNDCSLSPSDSIDMHH